MNLFVEMGIIITLTAAVAILCSVIRQPLIISYILTGIIVGPYILNLINSPETMKIFSHLGISFLLFLVGLGLNPKLIKETGKTSIVTGIGQVVFTSVIGFMICIALGFSVIFSLYISIALTFSSTIIIMKLVTDKGEAETLYGRIAIGFLIVQDLVAMLILIAVSSTAANNDMLAALFGTLLKGFGLIALLFLFGYYALPKITRLVARSQELLLLFSVAWVTMLSALFFQMDFSIEIGALLAGITLSMSPYRYEISSKMRPLRDFFLVIFFILLGSQMSFGDIGHNITPIILLSIFVLLGNPLIVMVLMGLLGHTKKNGFKAGLTVAQISEFSIILIALGVNLGHIEAEALSFITAVGLITIAGSTYMVLYSDWMYKRISRLLSIFEFKKILAEPRRPSADDIFDIIIFGYDRTGFDVLKSLKMLNKKLIVVDHNPEVVLSLAEEGIACKYGDAGDAELLDELNVTRAEMVVSTVPDFDANILLINKVREKNRKSIVVAMSHRVDEALLLYERGATYVIVPHFLGGLHTAMLIEKHGLDLEKFIAEKTLHIDYLKKRKLKGQEHHKS